MHDKKEVRFFLPNGSLLLLVAKKFPRGNDTAEPLKSVTGASFESFMPKSKEELSFKNQDSVPSDKKNIWHAANKKMEKLVAKTICIVHNLFKYEDFLNDPNSVKACHAAINNAAAIIDAFAIHDPNSESLPRKIPDDYAGCTFIFAEQGNFENGFQFINDFKPSDSIRLFIGLEAFVAKYDNYKFHTENAKTKKYIPNIIKKYFPSLLIGEFFLLLLIVFMYNLSPFLGVLSLISAPFSVFVFAIIAAVSYFALFCMESYLFSGNTSYLFYGQSYPARVVLQAFYPFVGFSISVCFSLAANLLFPSQFSLAIGLIASVCVVILFYVAMLYTRKPNVSANARTENLAPSALQTDAALISPPKVKLSLQIGKKPKSRLKADVNCT